jgi:hypothetical protein
MISPGTPENRTLDCMIVGGHKCGTTSLKEYLGEHPEVATHPQIEFTAFTEKEYSPEREAGELERLLGGAGSRLTLAKHAGIYAEPPALDRLRASSPDCRVVFVLRDPVARARSAFRMESLMGVDQYGFEEFARRAVAGDETIPEWHVRVYLEMGLWGRWLEEILDRFPAGNVKILFQEELAADTAAAYAELCEWLGIDPGFVPDLGVRHNVGADPRSPRLARALKLLRSERNPAKRAARTLLPERAYLRLAGAVRDANRDAGETTVDAGTEALLREWFAADEAELRRLLDRPLPW